MKIVITTLSIALIFIKCDHCDNGQTANGTQVEHYSNGKVRSEIEVRDCLCNGHSTEYYVTGEIEQEGNCKDGLNIGKWITFSTTKDTIAVKNWKKGELQSIEVFLENDKRIFFNKNNSYVIQDGISVRKKNAFPSFFKKEPKIKMMGHVIYISNYGEHTLISENLDILFTLDSLRDVNFKETYSKRVVNYEIKNSEFLPDGLELSLVNNSILLSVYYLNDSSHEVRKSDFKFQINK